MKKLLLLLLVGLLAIGSVASAATLNAGGVMTIGSTLYSDNGQYVAYMQGDGNFVVYRAQDMKALWSSQTSGQGGTFVEMQYDGNFVMYNAASQALWSTQTGGKGQAYFTISDVGQALVLSATRIWDSQTSDGVTTQGPPAVFPNGSRINMDGTSYFQNNGRYRLAFQTDGNFVLYKDGVVAFKTNTSGKGVTQAVISDSKLVMMQGTDREWFQTPLDTIAETWPAFGYLAFQPDGNLVIYAPLTLWAASSDDAPAPVHGTDPRCPSAPQNCLGAGFTLPFIFSF